MDLGNTSEMQRAYWTKMAEEHAGSVKAVGSESPAHKSLRYKKIAGMFQGERNVSVHDVGAGVGDFYEYLRNNFESVSEVDYSASEITATYCELAAKRFPDIEFLNRDLLAGPVDDEYDFVVLSGVFHQKADASHRQWIRYRDGLLERAWAIARQGIAFNVLSLHADHYNAGNYYADLGDLQTFIVRRLSRFFRMDHAYPLFEATFHVFKPDRIRRRYKEPEFVRYFGGD